MIVITGLDGSGKSTLLNQLKVELKDKIILLNVPSIDTNLFKDNRELFKASIFINDIGVIADVKKEPTLKVIAIFSAMVIFQELVSELKKNTDKVIFAERHPLIDTFVYVSVYLKVMRHDLLNDDLIYEIEKKYKNEIDYIINRITTKPILDSSNQIASLIDYLRQWFSDENQKSIFELSKIFNVELPKMVYLLTADPNYLYQRIKKRKVKEYHESIASLKKMQPFYVKILAELKIPYEMISTDYFNQVLILKKKIVSEYA